MTARAPRLRAMDTCDLLDRARVLEVCEGQASSDREPNEALLPSAEAELETLRRQVLG